MIDSKILELETKACFDFFWNECSLEENTYGLIRDNTKLENMSSIASIGYGLCAIIIGIERKYISYEEGKERVEKTLNTMYNNIENKNGFYYHFLDMKTGKRYSKCEISIIDTAIFIMGALTVGEYFNGEIKELAEKLYLQIDWDWYRNKETNQFYMGYLEEKGGFFGAWDLYAEQMMMYVLACGSKTYLLDESIYYDCPLIKGSYNQFKDIYHSHCGALFVYQFSHAFIDFRNKKDKRGIDWFENSVKATLANRQYCIDNKDKYKTFNENAWGMTACDTKDGYNGAQGAPPSYNNNTHKTDGTIPPCGAIGSIVFTPKESIQAMEYFYNNKQLWGKYGFIDAYNLDVEPNWYSDIFIGIDKGISIVMIENYRTNLIWNLLSKNQYIKKGLEILQIK